MRRRRAAQRRPTPHIIITIPDGSSKSAAVGRDFRKRGGGGGDSDRIPVNVLFLIGPIRAASGSLMPREFISRKYAGQKSKRIKNE